MARRTASSGELEVRGRVDALFARLDQLTPDDLSHVGLRRADGERDELRQMVVTAARAAGRSALLAEARAGARDLVLRRYAAGTLHPTWVGLNWGLSQGTADDRVAIVEAVQDAAAAAVVEDLVPDDVTRALALDAGHALGLSVGDAWEGSLDRALRPSPTGRRTARLAAGTLLVGMLSVVGFLIGFIGAGVIGGVIGLGLALLLIWTIARPLGDRAR